MRRASVLWEVFVLRFEEAPERYRQRRLTAEEAGELLGLSGRHFRRLMGRYEEEGAEGLRHRRLGKPSLRRAPLAELSRMQILHQERYRDFTVKHFPRAAGKAARLQARLHGDPAGAARRRAGCSAEARRRHASQEARAPALARHAGLPGRLDLPLD